MLEWLGIAALYAGCFGFMAWWIFRPKKGSARKIKTSSLNEHLESAFQRATQALERAQKENPECSAKDLDDEQTNLRCYTNNTDGVVHCRHRAGHVKC